MSSINNRFSTPSAAQTPSRAALSAQSRRPTQQLNESLQRMQFRPQVRWAWKKPTLREIAVPVALAAGGIAGSAAVGVFFPPLLAVTLPLAIWGIYKLVRACMHQRADFTPAQTDATPARTPSLSVPNRPTAAPAAAAPAPAAPAAPAPAAQQAVRSAIPAVPAGVQAAQPTVQPAEAPVVQQPAAQAVQQPAAQAVQQPAAQAVQQPAAQAVQQPAAQAVQAAAPVPAEQPAELPPLVAHYVKVMATPGRWGSELEAQALSKIHKTIIRIWEPSPINAGHYKVAVATNPGGEDGAQLPVIDIMRQDKHYVPLLDVEQQANGECTGKPREAGREGDCLFLAIAYHLEPADNSPIRDIARLNHALGDSMPLLVGALRADARWLPYFEGATIPDRVDYFMKTLRSKLVQPWRNAACAELAADVGNHASVEAATWGLNDQNEARSN